MENSDCLIRPMRPEDIPAALELHWNAFGMDSGLRFFEKAFYPTILDPGSTGFCLVAVRKGKVIGFKSGAVNPAAFHCKLCLAHWMECLIALARKIFSKRKESSFAIEDLMKLFSKIKNPPEAWTFHFAIDPECRGGGIARKLVEAFLEYCRSHRVKRCWTRTLRTNHASLYLLKEYGFKIHEDLSRKNKLRYILYKEIGIAFPEKS